MTKGSSAARQDLRKRRGLSKLEQGYMGFVLILPWLIGFCIFKLYPFVSSLVYSFTDYDLFRGVQNVVGFQNYIDAFTKAKNVKALKVTFTYAFMTVPLKLIFALFIAYILNFKIRAWGFSARRIMCPPFWAARSPSRCSGKRCSRTTAW